VGIRPGEKIHEEMITTADSYYTYDVGDYYVILPPKASNELLCSLEQSGCQKVPEGFHYNSGLNENWMSVEGLRKQVSEELEMPASLSH
jgi:FlaA1/EpsC-like NDP-sugar epimerase